MNPVDEFPEGSVVVVVDGRGEFLDLKRGVVQRHGSRTKVYVRPDGWTQNFWFWPEQLELDLIATLGNIADPE